MDIIDSSPLDVKGKPNPSNSKTFTLHPAACWKSRMFGYLNKRGEGQYQGTPAKKKKFYGPNWTQYSPNKHIKVTKLVKAVCIKPEQLLNILDPETWLSSDEIDAALFYISRRFPGVDGFQSTLLFQTLQQGGVVGTPESQFVQVLNIDDNHWITASNIFCEPDEVCIYDSLDTIITKQTEQKISWLIRPQASYFTIRKPSVQMQQSLSSCGMFALAFATVLCYGFKPDECQFQESDMRQVLYSALIKEKAPFFTFKFKPRQRERLRHQVDVHCLCRTAHSTEVMIPCSICKVWYHPNCVSLPPRELHTAEKWDCEICTNKQF